MIVPLAANHDLVDYDEPLTVEAAYARVQRTALAESAIGLVGLEIESHLVDLDSAGGIVSWDRIGRGRTKRDHARARWTAGAVRSSGAKHP